MGTPDFAAHSLKVLCDSGANVVAVITAPDRPAGRGLKLQSSAVKKLAEELNLPVLQPVKLRDEEFQKELRSYNADLQIVVAFRMLPESVWNMPPKGTFNLHASLLPQYRGAAPINWAVINGEKETGVTTFFLNHDIDTGNIIMAEKVVIGDNDTAGVIHDKLMNIGAELVVKTVKKIANGNVVEIPQMDDGELLPAPKIFKDDCKINWNSSASKIHNLIRGMSPYPAAWTEVIEDDKSAVSLKIFLSEIVESDAVLKPGELCSDGKEILYVGTSFGVISIKELQLAGKRRMKIGDFLRGFKIENNIRFQ